MRKYRFATPLTCALWLGVVGACENDDVRFADVAVDANGSALDSGVPASQGGPPPQSSADAAASAPPPGVSMSPTGQAQCGTSLCACNNGVDDDGDGTVDGFDVECTGGLDDDEGTFATGLPGDNRDPKWQDCFFDGNSGAGDDKCRYPTECLTGELPADDRQCAIVEACRINCQPLTPNGCDCFGCCSVGLPGGGSADVILSGSCSLDEIGDAEACPPCSKSTSCGNDCGECELCAGKTPDDLPPSCHQDPPADEACDGQASCSEDQPCEAGQFCSLGCCILMPVIR